MGKSPSFKKVFGMIHLWLGLTSGLVVFIVSLTGALLTFEEEIERYLISRDLYFVEVQDREQLPLDSLMNIATPHLEKMAHGHKATRVFFSAHPDHSVIVGFSYEDTTGENHRAHVFINPYTGEVLGSRPNNPHHHIWSLLTDIHINLLLGEFGNALVTWGTLVFLVMLISGIILWWPKNKAALQQRYKFKWKPTTKWKRKNYDLHNVLGFYASWIVLFMVLTGAMWAFEWFNNGVYFVTSGGKPNTTTDAIRPKENKNDITGYPIVFAQYVIAQQAFQKSYPAIYNASEEICIGYFANHVDRTFDISSSFDPDGIRQNWYISAMFDKKTNTIEGDNFDSIHNLGDAIQQSTNEIHYGTFFGLTSKIATFLACLIAASLPITGFVVWYGRRKKEEHSKDDLAVLKSKQPVSSHQPRKIVVKVKR